MPEINIIVAYGYIYKKYNILLLIYIYGYAGILMAMPEI
jgi:hypothetical protein